MIKKETQTQCSLRNFKQIWSFSTELAEATLPVDGKKMFLKISQYLQEAPVLNSFLVKLQAGDLYLYKIETAAQVFSSEFARFFRTSIWLSYVI